MAITNFYCSYCSECAVKKKKGVFTLSSVSKVTGTYRDDHYRAGGGSIPFPNDDKVFDCLSDPRVLRLAGR